MKLTPNAPSIVDFSWLAEVEESGPRLDQQSPIQVRRFAIPSGLAMTHPECHPYCELGLHLSGCGSEFVEREKIVRKAGDLFIAGPGVPHWFKTLRYPLTGVVIYFLPGLLCEYGPKQDGLYLLRRFMSKQTIKSRLVRPSPPLRKRLTLGFETIHREFEAKALGYEIRLRTLLMEMLVDLVRWERKIGREETRSDSSMNWHQVNQALQFLREHFAETVYARDVAAAAGLSESRLKVVFREALGMPWSRYIQGYRIQQAVALLGASNGHVTEAALAVGFESLSHFNATFHSFMGMSPSAYLKSSSKP